jgi:hypothetical protein
MFTGERVEKKKKPVVNLDDDNAMEDMMNKRKDEGPEREAYQEEKDKMEEWKKIEADQNEKLKDVHGGVKQMKIHAKEIGKAIDQTAKNIDKTTGMADKTGKNIEKSNKQIKEILEKVGGASNFCVDVILICVCLGLCFVLYNLIANSSSTPEEEVKKRFLMG